MSDLKYRFDELITTINLLPDEPEAEEMGDVVFPNLTRDLHEPELYTAILCQTMKGDEEFRVKMCATLSNSAMTNIMANEKPNEDDLYALAISANIMWATGVGSILLTHLGMIGTLCSKFDLEVPELATLILRGNSNADKFGELDPYRILKGEYTIEDILRHASHVAEKDR